MYIKAKQLRTNFVNETQLDLSRIFIYYFDDLKKTTKQKEVCHNLNSTIF